MLKIPSEYQPEGVSVYYHGPDSSHDVYTLDEETKEQILQKVLTLEPLPEEEQREMSGIDGSSGETSISIWYPRKHGHSYHIWVSITDDVIRIHKSHSLSSDPIYQDNGLLEILKELRDNQEILTISHQ